MSASAVVCFALRCSAVVGSRQQVGIDGILGDVDARGVVRRRSRAAPLQGIRRCRSSPRRLTARRTRQRHMLEDAHLAHLAGTIQCQEMTRTWERSGWSKDCGEMASRESSRMDMAIDLIARPRVRKLTRADPEAVASLRDNLGVVGIACVGFSVEAVGPRLPISALGDAGQEGVRGVHRRDLVARQGETPRVTTPREGPKVLGFLFGA